MWKSFFLAVGIFTCIMGLECMVLDRATLTDAAALTQNVSHSEEGTSVARGSVDKELTWPEWLPWSLLSSGAVVIIYAFSLPKRMNT